jgi:hypothetical protein
MPAEPRAPARPTRAAIRVPASALAGGFWDREGEELPVETATEARSR